MIEFKPGDLVTYARPYDPHRQRYGVVTVIKDDRLYATFSDTIQEAVDRFEKGENPYWIGLGNVSRRRTDLKLINREPIKDQEYEEIFV